MWADGNLASLSSAAKTVWVESIRSLEDDVDQEDVRKLRISLKPKAHNLVVPDQTDGGSFCSDSRRAARRVTLLRMHKVVGFHCWVYTY